MNISELSIGDWVFHDDIVFGREFGKVNRLSKNQQNETIGITVYRSDGAFGVVGYILTSITDNDIQPIPLTPEILEKNGWSKKYDDVWECGVWRISQINKCLFILYNEKYDCDFCVYIDTVHQLQHALRLAGIDKEIVL